MVWRDPNQYARMLQQQPGYLTTDATGRLQSANQGLTKALQMQRPTDAQLGQYDDRIDRAESRMLGPAQGRQAGNVFVAANPLEHLGHVISQYRGRKAIKGLSKAKQEALAKQEKVDRAIATAQENQRQAQQDYSIFQDQRDFEQSEKERLHTMSQDFWKRGQAEAELAAKIEKMRRDGLLTPQDILENKRFYTTSSWNEYSTRLDQGVNPVRAMDVLVKRRDPTAHESNMLADAEVNRAKHIERAGNATVLAEMYEEQAGALAGAPAQAYEWLKEQAGGTDGLTALRKRHQGLIGELAIDSLPPGPASDVDIQNAYKPFPKPTDNPKYVASWLRGRAKLERYYAERARHMTDYARKNEGYIGGWSDAWARDSEGVAEKIFDNRPARNAPPPTGDASGMTEDELDAAIAAEEQRLLNG